MKNIVMIIPPEPLCHGLEELMKKLNSKYQTTEALLYKPHITLKSLGNIEDKIFVDAMAEISHIVDTTKPFSVRMFGLRFYGTNESINGIYIPVGRTPELFSLHKRLIQKMGKYSDGRDRSYKEMENWNPHLTLVGNDIDMINLKRAKRDLEGVTYSYNFPVKKIIFRRHTEEGVIPFHSWYFHLWLPTSS